MSFQTHYLAAFSREQGFSEADWLRCLPGAVGGLPIDLSQPGHAQVALEPAGRFTLRWQVLPPRGHGLVRLPRLAVDYRFDGVDEAQRQRFMRHFDLYTLRGGG